MALVVAPIYGFQCFQSFFETFTLVNESTEESGVFSNMTKRLAQMSILFFFSHAHTQTVNTHTQYNVSQLDEKPNDLK